jgi:hypothetical protein
MMWTCICALPSHACCVIYDAMLAWSYISWVMENYVYCVYLSFMLICIAFGCVHRHAVWAAISHLSVCLALCEGVTETSFFLQTFYYEYIFRWWNLDDTVIMGIGGRGKQWYGCLILLSCYLRMMFTFLQCCLLALSITHDRFTEKISCSMSQGSSNLLRLAGFPPLRAEDCLSLEGRVFQSFPELS